MKKLTYVCGDTHGCSLTLRAMLNEIGDFNKLIFLGDYIDRGPDSKGVIDIIMKLQEDNPGKVIALRGNHEDMCLHNYKKYDLNDRDMANMWYINGANGTLASFENRIVPDNYLEWMLNCPIMYEDENGYYVHAGFRPHIDPEYQLIEDMLWIRYDFLYSEYKWDKIVFHGHSAMQEVEICDNRINLDTACVFGKKLSCYCIEDKSIISVPNIEGKSYDLS